MFTQCHDLLLWLIPKSERFPRAHRFTLTQRMVGAALETLERLHEARYASGRAKADRLRAADAALAKVRAHLFLAHRLGWLTDGQYAHVSRLADSVGRLLGGWRKSLDGS